MSRRIYYGDKLINKVGIDRIVLNKVQLMAIDEGVFRLAMRNHVIRYDDTKVEGRLYYRTVNGVEFNFMKIDDNELGTFTFGVKHSTYGIYQFSPKETQDGINLVNFTAIDIHSFINNVKIKMKIRYGLDLEFSDSEIRETELSTTFALQYKFFTM